MRTGSEQLLQRIGSSWAMRTGIALFICLVGVVPIAKADHFSGANITYQCVGPNNYQVTLDLYLDCAGAPLTPQSLNFVNNCGVSFTLVGIPLVLTEEVSQLCGSQLGNSTCNGGTQPGVMHYQFQTTLFLAPCNSWSIGWNICCRSATQNVQLTPGMYVSASLNNFGGLCDQSPQFGDETIPYVCVNEPVSYNPLVTDADGNTLVFSFISARFAAPLPTNVSYVPGFTAGAPIPGITLDPATGQINFTPTVSGSYVVALQVASYNGSGQLIGTVMRDFLFIVINCINPPADNLGPTSITNGIITSTNGIEVCTGVAFCVDISFSDVDPLAVITLLSTVAADLPGATFSVNGTNPAVATLCWTPVLALSPANVLINVNDGACPIQNLSTYAMTITVTAPPPLPPDPGTDVTINACVGSPNVNLFNQLGGTPDVGGVWTGPNGAAHPGTFITATDLFGQYTYTVGNGCLNASAVVTINQNASANAGTNASVTLCSNGAVISLVAQLGGAPQAGGAWSGPSPVIAGNYNPATMSPGVYTYTVTGTPPCPNATSTVTVAENLAPNAGTNGTLTVCSTSAATSLIAQLGGGPSAGGTWSGPSPVGGGGNYNPATMDPGVYTYTLVGVAPCTNSTATVTVTENPAASAGSNGSVSTCSNGATVALIASLGGAPQAGGAWSGPSPVVGGNYNPATMNPGVYTYTVTGAAPCPNATATVNVTENASPNAGTNGTLTICSSAAPASLIAQLGGGPSAGGTWSGPSPVGGAGNYNPATMNPGVYTYTVTGVAPCANATATVTVTENLAATAGSNGSITLCSTGASIALVNSLGGVPDPGGAWSGPSPVVGGMYDPATMGPGVYTYTVTGVAPCPNASATVTVTENAAPNAGANGALTLCSNGAAVALGTGLGGIPDAGGAWSGPSPVIGGNYDPATMNAGVYTYTVTGVAPCANASATVNVTENPATNAGSNGSITLCSSDASVSLFAQLGGVPQAGGAWSGPSPVVGGSYDPATMTAGVYTYTVTGIAPCVNASSTVTVTENAAPNAGINGALTLCSNGASVALITGLGGIPSAGGAWSGPSPVVAGNYDPSTMTGGVYTYTVAGVAPCANASATVTVTENPATNAGSNGSITLCSSDASVSLFAQLGGVPQAGGAWSGPSPVVGGSYDPATMTAGVYTYTVTGVAPCVNASATVTVTENATTNAGTNGSVTVCDIGGAVNLFNQLGGGPTAGGAWSGPSPVVGNSYDPATMTAGVYSYTVTGVAPCANASATVTVNETSSPNAGTNASVTVCGDGAITNLFTQLGGAPQAGGTWSGPSVIVGGNYDPATMNPGVYTYALVATAPCVSASATVTVTENAPTNAGTNGSITVCDIGGAVNLFNQLGGGPTAGGAWSGPSPVVGNSYDPATMTAGVYTYTVTGVAPCANASATVTVNETSSPNAGTNASITVCNSDPAFNLSTVLGGSPDAGGLWSGPSVLVAGSFDPATHTSGVYTYSIVGMPPCASASSTVTVSVEVAPDAGLAGSIDLCPASPPMDLFTLLGGSPQIGGIWTGPDGSLFDGTFDPSADASGDHTYTITGTACASSSAVVSVNVLPGPDAGGDNTIVVCNTQVAFTLISQLLGTPDPGGSWTNAAGDPVGASFNPLTGGSDVFTYSVSGSANCPDDEATVTITVNIAPHAGINGNLMLCASSPPISLFDGLGGTLDAGGVWTDAAGNSHATILNPATDVSGPYTYTVTGAAPCANASAVVTVVINPVPYAGEDGGLVLCTTSPNVSLISAIGGTPQMGGSWTGPDGVPSSGSFVPSTGTPGVYTYTIIGINPCVNDTSEVTIMVSIAADAGVGGSVSLCDGDPAIDLFAQLGGSPDATGVWTDPSGIVTTAQFDPLIDTPGTYTYTVTAIAPCPTETATIDVGVIAPVVTSFLTTSNGSCAPTLVNFSHDYTGPGTCTWILGNGDVIMDCAPIDVTYTQPGSYDVTLIIDANNGCGADTVTIVDAVTVYTRPLAAFDQLPAQLNTLDPVAFFNNTTNVANTYAWLINGEFITDEVDMQYRFPGEIGDTYGICLVAYAANSCADTVCKFITIDDGMQVFVPNTFTPDDHAPNNTFKPIVTGIDPRFYLFEIYDRWGNRLLSTTDPDVFWDGKVDGTLAQQDVYVWKLIVKDAYSGDRVERIGHVTLLR